MEAMDERINKAYDEQQQLIADQIKLFQAKLKAHKAKSRNNRNYGHVGDLEFISGELQDLNNFMPEVTEIPPKKSKATSE